MAGWPAKGGTWAISRRVLHRSVIVRIYLTLAKPQCCGQRLQRQMLRDASQEYFTIPWQRRAFLAKARLSTE